MKYETCPQCKQISLIYVPQFGELACLEPDCGYHTKPNNILEYDAKANEAITYLISRGLTAEDYKRYVERRQDNICNSMKMA